MGLEILTGTQAVASKWSPGSTFNLNGVNYSSVNVPLEQSSLSESFETSFIFVSIVHA